MGSAPRNLAGSQLPLDPIPAGKQGTAPLLQGPVPALLELLLFFFFFYYCVYIRCFLAQIFQPDKG